MKGNTLFNISNITVEKSKFSKFYTLGATPSLTAVPDIAASEGITYVYLTISAEANGISNVISTTTTVRINPSPPSKY